MNYIQVKQYRRGLQKERKKEFEEALVSTEAKLRAKQSVKMNEQIGDELRRWIKEYYERTGRFPDFPSEEGGGSRAMFSRQGNFLINVCRGYQNIFINIIYIYRYRN